MPRARRFTRPTFVLLTLLIVFVVGGSIGFGYLWVQRNAIASDRDNLKSDVDTLRLQLAQTQPATSSPTPSTTPTPSPANFSLTEFAASIAIPSAIGDLNYLYATDPTAPTMLFSTTALTQADSGCGTSGGNGGIGTLTRVAKGKPTPVTTPASTKVATAGAYDYYFHAPASVCSANSDAAAAQSQDTTALQAALASLK
jgi:hypothetical protein